MMAEIYRVEAPYRGAYRLERLTFGSGSPTVAVVGGLHGNELNGLHTCNILAGLLSHVRLQGTVHIFPAVNVFGMDQGTKRWPFDDRDINKAFPGDPAGSVVQRIAYALLQNTDADVCIDVHSASPLMRELPQVRVPLSGREVELGRAMGLPVVWRRAGDRLEATGLVGAWRQQGKSALHVLGGRGATLDVADSRSMAQGIMRLLDFMGILPVPTDPGKTLVDTTRAEVSYTYGSVGGFWVPEVRTGDLVKPGHLLGKITEVVGGGPLEEFRADREGVVVTMRTYPVVHAQELLVRVADPVGD
jgi:predicted deacylase